MSISNRDPIHALSMRGTTTPLSAARGERVGRWRPDDEFPSDGIASATAHGPPRTTAPTPALQYIEAAQQDLARLMRLIAEGNTAAATRIAGCIVEKGRAVLEVGAQSSWRAESLPNGADGAEQGAGEAAPRLSRRELDVLRMISQGLSNRQIAESSHRSLHTVDAHVKNIYRKLAVKSRARAVRDAMQKGLIDWGARE
jgi:DNA-binding CsgD family transcriptional regulator